MDSRGAGNSQRPQATRVRLGLIQNSRYLGEYPGQREELGAFEMSTEEPIEKASIKPRLLSDLVA